MGGQAGAGWVSAPVERLTQDELLTTARLEAKLSIERRSSSRSLGSSSSFSVQREIPVVDLSLDDTSAAAQLRSACTDYGFFYVANHGVSEELIQEQFEENRKFFALPLEEKLKIKAGISNRGYHPYMEGSAKNPFAQADRKEGFNAYLEFESEDNGLPFHGRNVWPSEEILPEYRRVMTEYYFACNAVAQRLLKLLALAMGLPPDFFASRFDLPVSNIRAVHYSAEASDPEAGIFGVGAHTDWGFLTVLGTDGVPGLQIFLDGDWLDAPHRDGMFVVNLGDMAHRYSNGAFKSTLHRVVKLSPKERNSTPFFLAPNWDAEVAPLPTMCSEDRPPSHPPTTCGEWLSLRRAAEYGTKTLQ